MLHSSQASICTAPLLSAPKPRWMPRAALIAVFSPSLLPVLVYAGYAAGHLM